MDLSQIPFAFQSRLRLSVVAALLTGPQTFRGLQELTSATPGNLGRQLEQLEEEGYISSKRTGTGRTASTTYSLRPFGREQFTQYVTLLAGLLEQAEQTEEKDPAQP